MLSEVVMQNSFAYSEILRNAEGRNKTISDILNAWIYVDTPDTTAWNNSKI